MHQLLLIIILIRIINIEILLNTGKRLVLKLAILKRIKSKSTVENDPIKCFLICSRLALFNYNMRSSLTKCLSV